MNSLPADRILRTVAARRAGVAAPTVTRWIQRGLIAGYRVGGRVYVSAGDLEAMLADARISVNV
jgi:excisionase family DNA binding protein